MLYLFIVGWCAKISYKLALISYSTVNELFQRKRSKLGLKNTLVLDLLDFFYGAISSRAILKLTALVPRKLLDTALFCHIIYPLSDKTKLHSWKFHKMVLYTLWHLDNFEAKKQYIATPINFPFFFFFWQINQPWKFHFFYGWPL